MSSNHSESGGGGATSGSAAPPHAGGGSIVTPVGITIAYKRLAQEGGGGSTTASSWHGDAAAMMRKSKSAAAAAAEKKRKHERIQKPISSFQVFLEGATVYVACLVLPTCLGYLIRWFFPDEFGGSNRSPSSSRAGGITGQEDYFEAWSNYAYDTAVEYLCEPGGGVGDQATLSDTSTWTIRGFSNALGVSEYYTDYLCPPPPLEEPETFVLSPDTGSWETDAMTVAIWAAFLALLRLAVVQGFVPKEDRTSPQQVAALVRCKSIHLLSADYSLSPAGTPIVHKRVKRFDHNAGAGLDLPSLEERATTENEPPMMPDTGVPMMPNITLPPPPPPPQDDDDDDYGVPGDDQQDTNSEREREPLHSSLFMPNPVSPPTFEDDETSLGLGSIAPTPPPTSSSSRLYAAPRYATALFRLVYTSTSIALALICFRHANFWPWFVGGQGSTANCWDLSGGLTVGMDSDFDHSNHLLKRYFLYQASYHWHSGAFHILSMLLVLLHRQPTAENSQEDDAVKAAASRLEASQEPPPPHRRFLTIRSSTAAYIRSLAQHMLALFMIAIAYMFSSLRRLGAIGMFAFDASSWFLHLQQLSINAPNVSSRRNMQLLVVLHRFLVIPAFLYARLFIWPALWYSVASESAVWLLQLERTLWKGSAQQLRWLMHGWMVLVMSMTVIYFRRLWSHPHMKRIVATLNSTTPAAAADKKSQ